MTEGTQGLPRTSRSAAISTLIPLAFILLLCAQAVPAQGAPLGAGIGVRHAFPGGYSTTSNSTAGTNQPNPKCSAWARVERLTPINLTDGLFRMKASARALATPSCKINLGSYAVESGADLNLWFTGANFTATVGGSHQLSVRWDFGLNGSSTISCNYTGAYCAAGWAIEIWTTLVDHTSGGSTTSNPPYVNDQFYRTNGTVATTLGRVSTVMPVHLTKGNTYQLSVHLWLQVGAMIVGPNHFTGSAESTLRLGTRSYPAALIGYNVP